MIFTSLSHTHLTCTFAKDGDRCLLFFRVIIHPLPNNKILDWSKFKAFAENKIHVAENLTFVLQRVENIVGKGKNAGYKHFLFFPQCFQRDL